jgi:hypothetical protein
MDWTGPIGMVAVYFCTSSRVLAVGFEVRFKNKGEDNFVFTTVPLLAIFN